MTAEAAKGPAIERYTIFPIPLEDRHGRARDLFTLWFGANITILTVVTGALSTSLFKLPLGAALLAIVVGNLVGGVFMALHAAQGPQLGVPQMVQSRGQFGSIGALVIVAFVIVMYVGFVASNLVLGAQSLRSVAGGVSQPVAVAIIAALSLLAAVYGHDLLHACGRWTTLICGLALLAGFFWIAGVAGVPHDLWRRGDLTLSGVLGMISVGALWQISYAPYVSDYSRYMPEHTGVEPAFWGSYWGCVLGSVLPMMLGALLGLIVVGGDVVTGLARATGPLSLGIVAAFSLGISSASAMNVYCCVLSTQTAGQTLAPTWRAGPVSRITLSVLCVLAALAIALLGAKNFLVNYENFLSLLLCVMAPWTAINLVDFYGLQHGRYDVDAFFAADGGRYGRYNAVALLCFGLGVLVQIPFLATDIYKGPIAKALGGADVSWLVGLAVVGPIYYLAARLCGRSDLAAAALAPAP
jgi:NCS1 family nucleobase:cation symporter-1